jgi:hypothetical protein
LAVFEVLEVLFESLLKLIQAIFWAHLNRFQRD